MIVFFGPAGAGKSVQGQIMAARHGWRWLSIGQLLRDTHDIEVLKEMQTGQLLGSELVNRVVTEALNNAKDIDKVILDGFPRRLDQAEWLIDSQKTLGRMIDLAIVLEVPKAEIMDRLHVRGRVDDTPEAIEERLQLYRKDIYAILALMNERKVPITHVDGTGTVGQVHDRIEAELAACTLV
jgi:adenylate kinase